MHHYHTLINVQTLKSKKDQWDDLFISHIVKLAYHGLVHFTLLTPALSPINSVRSKHFFIIFLFFNRSASKLNCDASAVPSINLFPCLPTFSIEDFCRLSDLNSSAPVFSNWLPCHFSIRLNIVPSVSSLFSFWRFFNTVTLQTLSFLFDKSKTECFNWMKTLPFHPIPKTLW